MMVSVKSVNWSAVVLDLLNTTPVLDGRGTDELCHSWLLGHQAADESLEEVRKLRDDLQRVVRGSLAPAALDGYLRGVAQLPEIVDDAIIWRLNANWTARVVLAWGQLQADAAGRLRPCANGECHLFLLDRTRAGTARWCSMSVCGNRMKARRHSGRKASG